MPQGRERIFIISIRKDIDNYNLKLPTGRLTNKTLKDIIEFNSSRKQPKESIRKYINKKYFTKKYSSNMNIHKLFDGYSEGYFKSSFSDNRIFSINGVSPTITTRNNTIFYEINGHLTQRERFKLQGFNPDYVNILKENGITNSKIDLMSGNTITVNVVQAILKELFLQYNYIE